MDLGKYLRRIPGYPKEGVTFIDITTVLKDPILFKESIGQMKDAVADLAIDIIVGAESRGFIMGAPLAYALGAGFVPVRKKGRLPAETVSVSYELEYGTDTLEIHKDAIKPGMNVLIVDDLLATGGTAEASCRLIEELGGTIKALLFFIELSFLGGQAKLDGYDVRSILKI